VHYGTPLLVIAYVLGIRLAFHSGSKPMWSPRKTPETVEDLPEERSFDERSLARLWVQFAFSASAVMAGGVVVAHVGGRIVSQTGLEESLMGGVFTAVSTSLPELVTTIAAVRRGALTLAVGDIVGGNAFDVLFVCAADVAYVRGPIFGAAGRPELYLIGLTVVLNVLLLMGMLHRQRKGPGNIGFESALVLAVYAAGIAGLVALRGAS
jgi:cation:H+ antiporter